MSEIFDIISAVNRLKDKVVELSKRVEFICKYPSLIGNVRYVDEKTACKMFKISRWTLARLRTKKLLKYAYIGRKIVYPLADLQQFMQKYLNSYDSEY